MTQLEDEGVGTRGLGGCGQLRLSQSTGERMGRCGEGDRGAGNTQVLMHTGK